jgi:hypothetical protein
VVGMGVRQQAKDRIFQSRFSKDNLAFWVPIIVGTAKIAPGST